MTLYIVNDNAININPNNDSIIKLAIGYLRIDLSGKKP